MRQRRTALKHVLSWERLQGSVGEPIPPQSQRQGPKPDRPTQPTIPALVSPDGGDLFLEYVRTEEKDVRIAN